MRSAALIFYGTNGVPLLGFSLFSSIFPFVYLGEDSSYYELPPAPPSVGSKFYKESIFM
jgi:hypothetical protein